MLVFKGGGLEMTAEPAEKPWRCDNILIIRKSRQENQLKHLHSETQDGELSCINIEVIFKLNYHL